jgi:hypothetical protein
VWITTLSGGTDADTLRCVPAWISVRDLVGPVVGCLTFVFGSFITNVINTDRPRAKGENRIVAAQPAAPSVIQSIIPPVDDNADGLGCWGDENEHPRFGPIRVGRNRVVDTVCGTIFMRKDDDLLVWRSNIGAPLTDSPKLVDGELVVLGDDSRLVGIDSETGVVNWEHSANGRSAFIQLERFGSDKYLVLVDMSLYDEAYELCVEQNRESDATCRRTIPDTLWLLRKDFYLREWSVPAASKVLVRGTRILVVVRRGKNKKQFEIANVRR